MTVMTMHIDASNGRRRVSDRKTKRRGTTKSTRLAIVRPFCDFDANVLLTTFERWNSFVPCRAAVMDPGYEDDDDDGRGGWREEEGILDEWVIFDVSVNGTDRRMVGEEEGMWECEESDRGTNGEDSGDDDGGSGDKDSTSSSSSTPSPMIRRCRRKRPVVGAPEYLDGVLADGSRTTSVDLFLLYSRTYTDSNDAVKAVDAIIEEFLSPGGWGRCFVNVFAVEAGIPKELDLYIPEAQSELLNWVNGPNRQYGAAYRIVQSGEWGNYEAFYLMEGESVPVKNYWLDAIIGEVDAHRPFAVLGSRYNGDKWDGFYESMPISLLHHANGNGIYNVSHPLLERITGQLEVEATGPYNSIPYDYRMSQIWTEGTLGIVPKLAPKIMLNEEGENITLSDNLEMFSTWADRWKGDEPYKFTNAIQNYAATNIIPRNLGPEYVVHGAKLYSPWDPTRMAITLVVSDWFYDRSLSLIKNLDDKDHPFSSVVIMIPESVSNSHDYSKYTSVPVTLQYRHAPDFMDLCAAKVMTDWFMITNSYHQVSRHVDLMFTSGFVPVIPFTPATYPLCLKYPYCMEIIMLSQRWHPKTNRVVLDMDMLYNTKERNEFCTEWMERYGANGQHLYATPPPLRLKRRGEEIVGPKGPTATDYLAYLTREKKGGMYKLIDRSLYGARRPFTKVFRKEENLDGLSVDELAKRFGMTLLSNTTECSCDRFQTENECLGSGLGCRWRPLFASCHPLEMIDDGVLICSTTKAATISPTVSIDASLGKKAPKVTGPESEVYFESRVNERDETGGEGVNDSNGDGPLAVRDLPALSVDKLANDILNSFDPISVSENMSPAASLLESFSRGEVLSSHQGTIKTSCPTYGPSIVPRRIEEFLYNNYSIDNGGRSFNNTASVIGRQVSTLVAVGRARHAQLQLVQFDPLKGLDIGLVKVPLPDEAKKRRTLVNYGETQSELRITFDTSSLLTLLRKLGQNFAAVDQYNLTKARINAYTDTILPSIVRLWGNLLRVYHPLYNVHPHSSSCGVTSIPQQHLEEGVTDADVVVYVEVKDLLTCSLDSRPELTICSFDQHMRPMIGSLSICLDDMDVQDNKVNEKEILHHTALLSQMLGRFLGLSPSLFKYFRNPATGLLWGERSVKISCGESQATRETMLSNIIQQGISRDGEPFYEVSSPTLRQVVRNHFDCQTLMGARLNGPVSDPNNDDECTFFNLDLRFHFDEDMTSISTNADGAFAVSPLSLALLEDSSWYKANFAAATTPSFGRGAGCGFVVSSCIVGGKVPDYSSGYFCASVELPGARSGCDYTHHHKAACDLEIDASPPEKNQYFLPSNPEFGSKFADVHYCPMRSRHLVPCTANGKAVAQLVGESFEENSRCFETDSNIPVCLETICNPVDRSLSFVVNGKHFYCSYYGEVINVYVGYSVFCPRIAVVCPDLVCPSNCSGKGVCDYCLDIPKCICDNPFDGTPGCYGGTSLAQNLEGKSQDEGSAQSSREQNYPDSGFPRSRPDVTIIM
ncbi:hypothetical protein ACHAXA_006643 [Cyclostephanos tholiformis]|uniref:Uncharacterized protein n=1 Tax=Cyclostephanos tholiformis TaxID=382380 RepID=A0ABD3R2J4_9STRA